MQPRRPKHAQFLNPDWVQPKLCRALFPNFDGKKMVLGMIRKMIPQTNHKISVFSIRLHRGHDLPSMARGGPGRPSRLELRADSSETMSEYTLTDHTIFTRYEIVAAIVHCVDRYGFLFAWILTITNQCINLCVNSAIMAA